MLRPRYGIVDTEWAYTRHDIAWHRMAWYERHGMAHDIVSRYGMLPHGANGHENRHRYDGTGVRYGAIGVDSCTTVA